MQFCLRFLKLVFIAQGLFAGSWADADIDPYVSPEWAFTNTELIGVEHEVINKTVNRDSPLHRRFLERIYQYYLNRHGDTVVTYMKKYKDGSFSLHCNQYGFDLHFKSDIKVIEVTPLSLVRYSHWKNLVNIIQENLFDPLEREFALIPSRREGGNHINVDLTNLPSKLLYASLQDLLKNPFLFRELFVDAIPLSALAEPPIKKLTSALQDYASANKPEEPFTAGYYDLLDLSFYNFYKETYLQTGHGLYLNLSWWAISLGLQLKYEKSLLPNNSRKLTLRLEYRGAPPSANAKIWYKEVQLIVERLRYLNTLEAFQPINIVSYPASEKALREQLTEYLAPLKLKPLDFEFVVASWRAGLSENLDFLAMTELSSQKLLCKKLSKGVSIIESRAKKSPKN